MRNLCPSCSSTSALGTYKCFKCGYVQATLSVSTYRKQELAVNYVALPHNLTYNPHAFHIDALAWLAKAYIYNNTIVRQRLAYHEETHRVFLPAYNNNTLMFYQMRALNTWENKYLTYGSAGEWKIHYHEHVSKTVVIVEDHLSAIRIRPFYNVIALSGTKLTSEICKTIVAQYDVVIFWLDADKPGRSALRIAIDVIRTYTDVKERKTVFSGKSAHSATLLYVNYDKITVDPKLLTNSDIKETLKNDIIVC